MLNERLVRVAGMNWKCVRIVVGRLGVERRYWLMVKRLIVPLVLMSWAAIVRGLDLGHPGVSVIDMM